MSASGNPLGSLVVKFLAEATDLHAGIDDIKQQLGSIGEGFDLKAVTEGFAEIAAAAGIATGAFEITKDALESFAKAENVQTSFALLTGSAEEAKTAFEGLKELAVTLAVPFETLISVSQRLAPQFGVGTEQLRAVLQAAGDAAAATGRDFDTIASGLDRIAITGAVSTRQLVQLGISVGDIASTMGVSVSEATELLKKNGQSAQADVDAVIATIESKFGGAAELIAQNLSGQFTNLKNELAFISEDLGAALAPVAEDLIAALEGVEPTLKGIAAGVVPAAEGFRNLADAIVSLVPDFLKIIASGSSMVALGTAIGFTAQAGKLLVDVLHAAVLETTDFVSSLNPFGDGLKHLTEDFNQAGIAISKDFAQFGEISKLGQQAADSLKETPFEVKFDPEPAKQAAASIYGITDAFKDLGVKTPPTQAELDKLANALETIKASYDRGLIPLQTYDAAVADFVKKMNSLQGAFQPDTLPADVIGQALKAAGIQNATDEIEKLKEGVAAAGAAFDLGRIPASAFAAEIDKLNAAILKNSTDGIAGLTTALSIAGENFATGKIGIDAFGEALDNLIKAAPAFQDAVIKQDTAIAGLNVTMATITQTVPSVDQILRSFGIETADAVSAHITALQAALDAANQDMKLGVPGAALAAQVALQALRQEQEKLSQTALDDRALGIPNLTTLKQRLDDDNKAFEDLANRGLLNATTSLEGLAKTQRDAIDLAVQQGLDTTKLRIDLDATTEALDRQANGMARLAGSLKQIELSGLQTAFHDLLFDIDKVGDDFKKLGESMVDTVVNKIIKDAMSPLLDSLNKVITSATTALEKLAGINVPSPSGTGIPTAGGVPISLPTFPSTDIGAPGTGNIGDIVPGGDTLAGTGTPAAAGSPLSGLLSGVLGPIASIGSLVTGIIGDFQNARQETSLNAIELNTRIAAIALEGNWKTGTDTETMFAFTKTTAQNTLRLGPMQGALDQINGHIIDIETYASQIAQAISKGAGAMVNNFYISGATDPSAVADQIATTMKTLNPGFV